MNKGRRSKEENEHQRIFAFAFVRCEWALRVRSREAKANGKAITDQVLDEFTFRVRLDLV